MPDGRPGTLNPFELAIHAPAQFAEVFGQDPDEYLRQLGFTDPDQCRRYGVEIVVRGKRQQIRNQRLFELQQREARLEHERQKQDLKLQLEFSRRRLRRLCCFVRRMIDERIQAAALRDQFNTALRDRRKDRFVAVASETELRESYRGNDLIASDEATPPAPPPEPAPAPVAELQAVLPFN